jgi:hypothetical protein
MNSSNFDFVGSQILSLPKVGNILRHPINQAFEAIEVNNPKVARWICQLIPPQCPFERDITLFGHTLFHIPALCKINPVYEQLMQLRFQALVFLADQCGEDVTEYCR